MTERQQARLVVAVEADDRLVKLFLAWQSAQQLRAVYHQPSPPARR